MCAQKGGVMAKNKPANRHYLLATGTKLWCSDPKCQTLRQVTDYFAGVDTVALDCGHRRKWEAQR